MKKKKKNLIAILTVIISIIYTIYTNEIKTTYSLDNTINTFNETTSTLTVSFLDVGQADAILIQNKDENMLIDAGNNEDGKLIVSKLQSYGIEKIDYLIGTHPHEDHIGGMDDVINNFEIGEIFMPDVVHSTDFYLDVLEAVDNKSLVVDTPNIDDSFYLGDAKVDVLYLDNNEKELNDCSIVLKVTFGKNKFLFMGDASFEVEDKILFKKIKADVLKVGHHGSNTSSSEDFLNAVKPDYAVISVGEDNKYNHPGDDAIDRLEEVGADIYRTDKNGDVKFISDGNDIFVEVEK